MNAWGARSVLAWRGQCGLRILQDALHSSLLLSLPEMVTCWDLKSVGVHRRAAWRSTLLSLQPCPLSPQTGWPEARGQLYGLLRSPTDESILCMWPCQAPFSLYPCNHLKSLVCLPPNTHEQPKLMPIHSSAFYFFGIGSFVTVTHSQDQSKVNRVTFLEKAISCFRFL